MQVLQAVGPGLDTAAGPGTPGAHHSGGGVDRRVWEPRDLLHANGRAARLGQAQGKAVPLLRVCVEDDYHREFFTL